MATVLPLPPRQRAEAAGRDMTRTVLDVLNAIRDVERHRGFRYDGEAFVDLNQRDGIAFRKSGAALSPARPDRDDEHARVGTAASRRIQKSMTNRIIVALLQLLPVMATGEG